jgi:membrane-bound lytic murein transglycosylase B
MPDPRRRLATLAAALALVSACGGTPTGPKAATPGSSTPTRSGGSATAAPSSPRTSDPAALADRLAAAVATIEDPSAGSDAVASAAEAQQLVLRTLALGSAALRRSTLASLDPATARQARAQLRASDLLTALTEPRRKFPPWHIVEPPPPQELLGYYREAQRRTGVPWTYLAAINLVETRMGRIRGPSTAGALGPMQFMPATWATYGAGGDINDPRDAVLAAARLLQDHGAPGDMAGALWHYNPSSRYVGAVTAYARTMQDSAAAYRGYWHWQVFCQLRRGAFVLPVGYPDVRPVPLPAG